MRATALYNAWKTQIVGTSFETSVCNGLDFITTTTIPICNLPESEHSFCSTDFTTQTEICNNICDNTLGCDYTECSDSIDNDNDLAIDYSDDFSCSSFEDNDETYPLSQCQDGIDNDGDGLADMYDPGCINNQDNDESDATSQCQDGIDNDNDGAIDYPYDFSCDSAQDLDETFPLSQCQDGLDNDEDGVVDLDDPGCFNNQDNDESDGTTECQDNYDNDADGWIDMLDPGCETPLDNNESHFGNAECSDGIDNDGDGRVDGFDHQCVDPYDNSESPDPERVKSDGDIVVERLFMSNDGNVRIGDFIDFTFEFRNRGDFDLEHVRIQVGIPEIGLSRRAGPFDLREGESLLRKVSLYIPYDTYPNEYLVRAIVYDEEAKRVQHRHITVYD